MSEPQKEPDWKAIAMQLAQRVTFALNNMTANGSGMIGNVDPEADEITMQHWRDYFADALDMVPGVKVDREVSSLMELPASRRKKALKELIAQREAAKAAA